MTLSEWLPVLAFMIVATIVPLGLLFAGIAFGARQRRPDMGGQKRIAFESGVSHGFVGKQRFPIYFYLTAMLFIVFDIELVFLFPLAVSLGELGMYGFWAAMAFVAVLAVADIYAWGRGALEWEGSEE